jgi:DNA-binding transcriptional LysR family regulator
MLGLIAAGLGVGTLPFSMIAALELKGLVCRRIRDAQTYRIMAVITPVARSTSPTTEPFVRLCLENAGSSPGSTA